MGDFEKTRKTETLSEIREKERQRERNERKTVSMKEGESEFGWG